MAVHRLRPDRTVTDGTGRKDCEVLGAADGAGVSVAWFMLPSGCKGAARRGDFTEVVIVLSGKGVAWLDGCASEIGAGHSVHVPEGSLWRLDNAGREPLVGYSICAPAFTPERSHPAEG